MKSLKQLSLVAVLAVVVAFISPVLTYAETADEAAAKLVDALKALNVDEVDYLYAYIQSVDLTDEEYDSILDNAERVGDILGSVEHRNDLSNAQKTEASRLFLDSVQKSHLNATFVDQDGKAFDIMEADLSTIGSINVQLSDLEGNVLATVGPKNADLNPEGIQKNINSLKEAVEAKVVLDETGEFVPMPESELPDTSTDLPLGIAVGSLIVVLGGLAFIPAVRKVRNMEA